MQVWIVIWTHFIFLIGALLAFTTIKHAADNALRSRALMLTALCISVPVHVNLMLVGMDGQNVLLMLAIPMMVFALLAAIFALFGSLHPPTRRTSLPTLAASLALLAFPLYADLLPDWSGNALPEAAAEP